jgi:hypothetical protein
MAVRSALIGIETGWIPWTRTLLHQLTYALQYLTTRLLDVTCITKMRHLYVN